MVDSNNIGVAPLLLWAKIWVSEELQFSREIDDCINLDKSVKIPWIRFVRDRLFEIGLGEYFVTPSSIPTNVKGIIKEEYCVWANLRHSQLAAPLCLNNNITCPLQQIARCIFF